jgi:alkylation response protein AidB-like acyl-CoA dehydrogenase
MYPDLDAITAGWIVPAGKLHRVDGGYRLRGQWQFGSGCSHADVIIGGAVVYEDGKPVMTEEGRPETRVAMLPAAEFEILDTWETTGLAGSGRAIVNSCGSLHFLIVLRDGVLQLSV